jgi:hypothetical protein
MLKKTRLQQISQPLPTDTEKSVQIAIAAHLASLGLDEDRSKLYFDLVYNALSEAARRALRAMNPIKYEYQSDFARHYVAQGRTEGRLEGETSGRAALVIKLLTRRFGEPSESTKTKVAGASVEELDNMAERLFTAQSLQEALGSN